MARDSSKGVVEEKPAMSLGESELWGADGVAEGAGGSL